MPANKLLIFYPPRSFGRSLNLPLCIFLNKSFSNSAKKGSLPTYIMYRQTPNAQISAANGEWGTFRDRSGSI